MLWQENDDITLASFVLQNAREGKGISNEIVPLAESLGRTVEECFHRWENVLRVSYEKDLALAKKFGKRLSTGPSVKPKPKTKVKKSPVSIIPEKTEVTQLSTEPSLIQLLEQAILLAKNVSHPSGSSERVLDLEAEIERLRSENERLKSEYRTAFAIIDRAKHLFEEQKKEA